MTKKNHLRLASVNTRSTRHLSPSAQKSKSDRQSMIAGFLALGLGVGGIVIASAVGVGEIMFGALVAYVTYRAVRYRIPPTQAIIEGVELEHGQIPHSLSKAS